MSHLCSTKTVKSCHKFSLTLSFETQETNLQVSVNKRIWSQTCHLKSECSLKGKPTLLNVRVMLKNHSYLDGKPHSFKITNEYIHCSQKFYKGYPSYFLIHMNAAHLIHTCENTWVLEELNHISGIFPTHDDHSVEFRMADNPDVFQLVHQLLILYF